MNNKNYGFSDDSGYGPIQEEKDAKISRNTSLKELKAASERAFENATIIYTPANIELDEEDVYYELYQDEILSPVLQDMSIEELEVTPVHFSSPSIWQDSEYVPNEPAFEQLSIEDKRYFIHLPLVELEKLLAYHRSLQPTSNVVNEPQATYKSAEELELERKTTATQLPIETIKLIENEPLQAKMEDILAYCKGLKIKYLDFIKPLLPQ